VQESLILFTELNLDPHLLRALEEEGYETPTPIQSKAIPPVLEGKDLLGIAQTGTGKTAAFALPILQRLSEAGHAREPRTARALVLAPTRELAIQVEESFRNYGRHLPLRSTCIFGGVGDAPQKAALERGVDILVATPGRLMDLIQQGSLHLKRLEIFVLDEADRMLDMGFIHDIRKVIAMLPARRQNLFFSATMPNEIATLANTILRQPVRVEVVPASTPIERIEQSLYFVGQKSKTALLRKLLDDESITRALVFTRMKHVANRVAESLLRAGIEAAAIHGNKSQTHRQKALGGFKDGMLRVLVATDIAARGIDVDGVSHVFNYDLPDVPETYVHRIGRTARAGASGIAVAFCSPDERDELRQIERLTRIQIPVKDTPVGFEMMPEAAEPARGIEAPQPVRSQNNRGRGGRGGNPPRQQSQGNPADQRVQSSQAPRRDRHNGPRVASQNTQGNAPRGNAIRNTPLGGGTARGESQSGVSHESRDPREQWPGQRARPNHHQPRTNNRGRNFGGQGGGYAGGNSGGGNSGGNGGGGRGGNSRGNGNSSDSSQGGAGQILNRISSGIGKLFGR